MDGNYNMTGGPWVPYRRCGSEAQCIVVIVFMAVGLMMLFYMIVVVVAMKVTIAKAGSAGGRSEKEEVPAGPTAPPRMSATSSTSSDRPPSHNPSYDSQYVSPPPSHNPSYNSQYVSSAVTNPLRLFPQIHPQHGRASFLTPTPPRVRGIRIPIQEPIDVII
eukprot:TRINITY_DN42769_c0_g1_i1.p1 TRINITY_DN42769_c0_g1~~TRINITY_DN42769_c0_g1_i1.p1  ORF type:complete len:162 (+),score=17.36 TRINITY_DN42769_c0_g1_i1:11-496(+)